jgi:periplasmic divalent cation tolerance protein
MISIIGERASPILEVSALRRREHNTGKILPIARIERKGLPLSAEFHPLIVLTTVGSHADAQRIAHELLESRLAACIQIEGPLESHYRWEGSLHCDPEWRCVIKTTIATQEALFSRLQELHPYQLPQILVIQATASDAYGSWLAGQ